MVELKKIDVLSAGVVQALIGVVVGVILAIIMLAFGSLIGGLTGIGSGIGTIILLPIIYGAFGFIGGVIGAALYNLVAGWVGGVKLTLE